MSETTIRLLWPPEINPRAVENVGLWGKHSAQDLSIDEIAGALSLESRYVNEFKTILLTLCPNPRVIQYRQAVLEDCLHSHRLRTGLDERIPALTEIKWLNTTPGQDCSRATHRHQFRTVGANAPGTHTSERYGGLSRT